VNGPGLYRNAIRVFSAVFIAIGLGVLGVTLADGGGPLSLGFLMGLAFVGIGVGRLWAAARMGQ
jgi:dipeptide/tripeptide permease